MYIANERGQCKKAIYCIIPTIWNSGKGKIIETVKDQWLSGVWWEERCISVAQGIFKAVKPFHMILWGWLCVITLLSQPIDYTTQRVNPNVNYGV